MKLNAEDIEALKGAFTLIDTNSDGKLSISEFLALFKAQGMNYTEEELKKFVLFFKLIFLILIFLV